MPEWTCYWTRDHQEHESGDHIFSTCLDLLQTFFAHKLVGISKTILKGFYAYFVMSQSVIIIFIQSILMIIFIDQLEVEEEGKSDIKDAIANRNSCYGEVKQTCLCSSGGAFYFIFWRAWYSANIHVLQILL
ncbi:hypothetical protein ACJX0J_014318, partial [Zea mays]